MVHIILVLTGYLNIILAAAYTLTSFQLFPDLPPKRKKKLFRRQEHTLLQFHYLSSLSCLLTGIFIREHRGCLPIICYFLWWLDW